ncbi:hypothetical protein Sjap_004833 [Stephania japonica]|uniref:Uncharacterized protein n=1 Tax=Stephania japonica TaxID=461633 RepID=A0AAP0K5B5_9MAGN
MWSRLNFIRFEKEVRVRFERGKYDGVIEVWVDGMSGGSSVQTPSPTHFFNHELGQGRRVPKLVNRETERNRSTREKGTHELYGSTTLLVIELVFLVSLGGHYVMPGYTTKIIRRPRVSSVDCIP